MITTRHIAYFQIATLAAILFLPFLGQVYLFDWDEINFAESAREMLLTGNYTQVQINFQPFWEKPPLFIWMQSLSMHFFGVNEYAARLPNAICGIATLLLIFHIGRKHISEEMGWWWTLAYAGCFLPHFYFKSGIIDPVFNLFIFLGIVQLVSLSYKSNMRYERVALAGLFIGLAVLTKGPVGLLIPLLCFVVFSIWKRNFRILSIGEIAVGALVFLAVTFAWYGIETLNNGLWFLKEFVVYQIRLLRTEDAGHGGPFFYHFVVILIGCFPASIFIYRSFGRLTGEDTGHRIFRHWMIVLFAVVLILFSIVKTKIIHYSSLTYFPLTFLAAYAIYKIHNQEYKWSNWYTFGLLFFGLILGSAFTLFPLLGQHPERLLPYLNDPFAAANLEANVDWPMFTIVPGAFYLIALGVALWFILVRKERIKALLIYFMATILVIQMLVNLFVPKIERYSQGAAIDFFRSLEGKDVYVEVLDYKSYAQLFYTKKQPVSNPDSYNKEWLLNGPIDKPAYFVCKNIKADRYRAMGQLDEIGAENGFVFFRREPPLP